jgi:hypothetical protein
MGVGPMEKKMRLAVLGAASIVAIALAACAKKDETKTAEAPAVEEAVAAVAEATDAAAEAADVYAAPVEVDLASVRTKDALTVAADTAFAQADADQNGSLSQTEFYSLAAMFAPAAAETVVDTVTDVAADAASGAAADATAVVGEVAGAPAGEAVAEVVEGVATEEPSADASALDASYATLSGGDASLTSDELRAAFLSRFDAADVNLDGSLDEAEAQTFKAAKLF